MKPIKFVSVIFVYFALFGCKNKVEIDNRSYVYSKKILRNDSCTFDIYNPKDLDIYINLPCNCFEIGDTVKMIGVKTNEPKL